MNVGVDTQEYAIIVGVGNISYHNVIIGRNGEGQLVQVSWYAPGMIKSSYCECDVWF